MCRIGLAVLTFIGYKQTDTQTNNVTVKKSNLYKLHFLGAVSPFSQSRHVVLPPDFEYNLNPFYGQPYGPYHKPYHGPYNPYHHRPNYGPYNGPSYGPYPNPYYGPAPHVDYSAPYGSPGSPPAPPFPVYGSEKDLITRNFFPPTVKELENAKKEKLKDLSNLTVSTVISVSTTTTETTSVVGNGNIIGTKIFMYTNFCRLKFVNRLALDILTFKLFEIHIRTF